MDRTDVVQAFIDGRGPESYGEAGIRSGHTFLRLRAARKGGVDPAPRVGALKPLLWRFRNPANRDRPIVRSGATSGHRQGWTLWYARRGEGTEWTTPPKPQP